MSKLNSFWANLDWDNWAYGLFSAFIGGGAGAFGAGMGSIAIDPHDFNVQTFQGALKVLLLCVWTFIFAGIPVGLAYLHNKPLPGFKSQTMTQKTEPDGATTTTTQKTEVTLPPPVEAPKP